MRARSRSTYPSGSRTSSPARLLIPTASSGARSSTCGAVAPRASPPLRRSSTPRRLALLLLPAAGGDPRRLAAGRVLERLDRRPGRIGARALHDNRLACLRRRERDVVEPVRLGTAVTGVEG